MIATGCVTKYPWLRRPAVHLRPDGSGPVTVVEWKGTVALPAKGVEPISVPLLGLTPNHATGQVLLPSAGTWEMRITVRLDEINQATVTAKIPVR